jgi:hypothetical protein
MAQKCPEMLRCRLSISLLDSAPEEALLEALVMFRSTYAARLDLMPRDSTIFHGDRVAEIDAHSGADRPYAFLTALWEENQDRYQDDPVGLSVEVSRYHRGDREGNAHLIVWHNHILDLPQASYSP